ncbi:MAG: hypothetical protein KF723_11840 [Rhizobiaceae bacterium]|nr:hypothetical protein [Rhizobiaceae bacterium]
MKWIAILWASPLAMFWGWYFLSLYDINFGYIMLSRKVHDLVFQLYGQMIGIDPATIPGLIAQACILDTAIIGVIFAYRRRRAIAARWHYVRARYMSDSAAPSA